MTLWIVALRGVGALLFFMAFVGLVRVISGADSMNFGTFNAYIHLLPVLETMAFALLCFGGAEGLTYLRRIERRVARQNALLKHLYPQQDLPKSLNGIWDEQEPRGEIWRNRFGHWQPGKDTVSFQDPDDYTPRKKREGKIRLID